MSEETLCTGLVDVVERGWQMDCPSCRKSVAYTWEGFEAPPWPWMYCSECSSVVCRDQDQDWVRVQSHAEVNRLGLDPGWNSWYYPTDLLLRLYEELEARLPPCPCGGSFRIWTTPRCPHCREHFDYGWSNPPNPERRFADRVIWLVGATWYGGIGHPARRLTQLSEPVPEGRIAKFLAWIGWGGRP